MNMQYLILGIPKIVWAPHHIFLHLEGNCIVLPKPKRNAKPSLDYTINSMG
jgi:hypothetical protein